MKGGSTPSTAAQCGTPEPEPWPGSPSKSSGVEEADLVAEAPAEGVDVGQGEPAGDPPVVVAVVVEDGAGQVGAAEGVIEPAGDQSGDRLGG